MLHVHDFSYVSYTCCARVPLRASRKILPPDLDPISSSSVSRIWLASRVYGIEHRLIEFEKENYTRGCPRQRRTEHGLFLRGSSLDLRGALHFQRVRVSLSLSPSERSTWFVGGERTFDRRGVSNGNVVAAQINEPDLLIRGRGTFENTYYSIHLFESRLSHLLCYTLED